MTSWLIVAVLEVLGLGLLWYGQRSGDDMLFALGVVLVVSVTSLFVFRLFIGFLALRRTGNTVPKHKGALLDVPGALALSVGGSVGGRDPEKRSEASRADADGPDFDLGDLDP